MKLSETQLMILMWEASRVGMRQVKCMLDGKEPMSTDEIEREFKRIIKETINL